ncbi:alpha/beta hydrolase [Streptomyces sp. NPDC005805]|uniref:alpha/beta hydrolase n=1 Tax=Streptomyces sp. NPDC005805 TaxID=3157068 RepID=UPI0033D19D96
MTASVPPPATAAAQDRAPNCPPDSAPVFVLVAEAHTGGWIWQEAADRLRELGAEAHPVTLTGMGDLLRPAGPGTDLETHVADVVRVIDALDTRRAVLVGHGYGIHPVLGAADRRPERVVRIVHLDAGLPGAGDAPLLLVPDEELRERLSGAGGGGWLVPPPGPGEWHRWGSTDGVPDAALARLAALAAPQPAATLTQPLKLTGAAPALPSTGVLCTANGSDIALVEMAVGLGDPRLQALAEPRVTFFELPTGHWPMLSAPEELARVLVRAARGEGHRITPGTAQPPAHLRPFVLDPPHCRRERSGTVDLYLPGDLPGADGAGAALAGGPRPAVVLVHGGPVPAGVRPTPRDWPAFVGYGRHLASLGVIAATVDHRLHGVGEYERAAEDVAAAVDAVRADPRVDGDRVALWFFSGGGPLSAEWLAAPPPWLRCVAATYPVLAPLPGWVLRPGRFRPVEALRTAGRLPVVLTRVGREHPGIAATVAEFVSAARECDAAVELIDVPGGHHGFETVDHTEEAREAVRAAAAAVVGHLRG